MKSWHGAPNGKIIHPRFKPTLCEMNKNSHDEVERRGKTRVLHVPHSRVWRQSRSWRSGCGRSYTRTDRHGGRCPHGKRVEGHHAPENVTMSVVNDPRARLSTQVPRPLGPNEQLTATSSFPNPWALPGHPDASSTKVSSASVGEDARERFTVSTHQSTCTACDSVSEPRRSLSVT